VIFSNAAVHVYGKARQGHALLPTCNGFEKRKSLVDHYTGVGEVLAVHELDTVFASLHQRIRVKRW